MRPISRSLVILLVFCAASALFMVKPAGAQTITKPSVPEFTVRYVDRSYDTQPTYGYDQYTGKTVITKPSEHIDNRTIEITIKNQPFTPFTDENDNTINLLYNVQYKGSFGENWTSMFGERSYWANGPPDPYGTYGYPTQNPSSQYTTISYTLAWNMLEGQMDLQVEALEGYTTKAADPAREHNLWTVYEYTFYGQESGWSNTQTVAYGGFSATTPDPTLITPTKIPNENSTQVPSTGNSQPNANGSIPFSIPITTFILVIAVFSAVIIALAFLLLRRKRKP
jgi:hypothetical protein